MNKVTGWLSAHRNEIMVAVVGALVSGVVVNVAIKSGIKPLQQAAKMTK